MGSQPFQKWSISFHVLVGVLRYWRAAVSKVTYLISGSGLCAGVGHGRATVPKVTYFISCSGLDETKMVHDALPHQEKPETRNSNSKPITPAKFWMEEPCIAGHMYIYVYAFTYTTWPAKWKDEPCHQHHKRNQAIIDQPPFLIINSVTNCLCIYLSLQSVRRLIWNTWLRSAASHCIRRLSL